MDEFQNHQLPDQHIHVGCIRGRLYAPRTPCCTPHTSLRALNKYELCIECVLAGMAQAIAQARNNPRMPYGCILLQQKTGVAVATGYYNEELYLVNCQMVRALTDRVSAGSYVARCYGRGESTQIKSKSDSYLTNPQQLFPSCEYS